MLLKHILKNIRIMNIILSRKHFSKTKYNKNILNYSKVLQRL